MLVLPEVLWFCWSVFVWGVVVGAAEGFAVWSVVLEGVEVC